LFSVNLFKKYKGESDSYSLLLYYISVILFFTNATLSFYIFFISTPNFRKQVKKILQCKFSTRNVVNNQVNTVNGTHNAT
jgi:hypothetical protein